MSLSGFSVTSAILLYLNNGLYTFKDAVHETENFIVCFEVSYNIIILYEFLERQSCPTGIKVTLSQPQLVVRLVFVCR